MHKFFPVHKNIKRRTTTNIYIPLLKNHFEVFVKTVQQKAKFSHIDPPANGQAVFFLTGLLEVFVVYF